MNRRLFLASAVAAGAGPNADGRRIKIGFLGGAYSHTKGKLEVLAKSSDFEVVGLWTPDPDLRDSFRRQGVPIHGRDELLNNSEVEVIAVQSAPPDHARQAMMVIEAGKHLHLEKPPALDIPSFRAVLEAAKRKERIVQLGYMWRHHPGFAKIFEMVRNGWLGDVYFVQATINKQLSASRRPEWAIYRGGQRRLPGTGRGHPRRQADRRDAGRGLDGAGGLDRSVRHVSQLHTQTDENFLQRIDITALSINDPGPEIFGKDGVTVARMVNDHIAGIAKEYRDRFFGASSCCRCRMSTLRSRS